MKEETMSPTPALDHLIGAYVNEDVFDEYGDVWAAVDDFVIGSPDEARTLPGEIATLLETHDDESLKAVLLYEFGIGFRPNPGEGGYRGWLIEVSRRVQAAIS
jgi:hypothetical protein